MNDNYKIAVPRGCTKSFTIILKKGDELYELQSGDSLYFGVKKWETDAECIISKTLTDADTYDEGYTIEIAPDDTAELEAGDYLYDIGLEFANGDFQQVVPVSAFVVERAITQRSGSE